MWGNGSLSMVFKFKEAKNKQFIEWEVVGRYLKEELEVALSIICLAPIDIGLKTK